MKPAATLLLQRPVNLGDQDILSLEFRPLTGGDIAACGFPVTLEGQIVPQSMAEMIARLSGQPRLVVDALAGSDWLAAAAVVTGLFVLPDPATLHSALPVPSVASAGQAALAAD